MFGGKLGRFSPAAAAFYLTVFHCYTAHADTIDVPIAEVCEGTQFNRQKFLQWALDASQLPRVIISEKSGKPETVNQEIRAVSDDRFCPDVDETGKPIAKEDRKCFADKKDWTLVQHTFVDKISTYFQPQPDDAISADVPNGTHKFRIERNQPPSGGSRSSGYPLNEILADNSPWRVSCGEEPRPLAATRLEDALSSIGKDLRLRASTDDLFIPQNDKRFKSLKSATLGITTDHQAHKNSYNIGSVLGYQVAPDSILFFQYDRQYVDASNVPKDSNINNMGFGLSESTVYGVPHFHNDFAVVPKLIYSPKSEAKILAGDLINEFHPDLRCVDTFCAIDPLSIAPQLFLQARGSFGHVFDNGGQPTLVSTTNFSRLGPEVGIRVIGLDGSLFEQVSFNTFYRHLWTLSGQFSNVSLYEATISYALPTLTFLSFSFSYDYGRDPDTFERENLWKLSLGLKF